MDGGWENAVMISLFTTPGYHGNVFAKNKTQKIGSRFEIELNKPITVAQISIIRDAGEKALQWMIDDGYASAISVVPTNPSSYRIETFILIQPQGQDIKVLLLKKNGLNWVAQKIDPAHLRI
jgi:phage gp46-like protein